MLRPLYLLPTLEFWHDMTFVRIGHLGAFQSWDNLDIKPKFCREDKVPFSKIVIILVPFESPRLPGSNTYLAAL
jgi:hypothetical protein